jgi:hypothetical protein
MTRAWWASTLLGPIARHHAVRLWADAAAARLAHAPDVGSFEDIFLGLSAFFGVSPFHVGSSS